MKVFTLNDVGCAKITEFVRCHEKMPLAVISLNVEAYFSEAENEMVAADAGDYSPTIEVSARYANDGRPHVLTLKREWFDLRNE